MIIFHVHRNNLQGRHLIRTANTPGSYEAATPSGLGATGVTCSPMAMSSPILTTRSLESFISVVILQHLVSCTHGWCDDQGMKFKRLKMSKVCEVIKKARTYSFYNKRNYQNTSKYQIYVKKGSLCRIPKVNNVMTRTWRISVINPFRGYENSRITINPQLFLWLIFKIAKITDIDQNSWSWLQFSEAFPRSSN